MYNVEQLFRTHGGIFPQSYEGFVEKATKIKVLLFDWDGVFNNGQKTGERHSSFSEPDSMGVNLLRYGLWITNSQKLPVSAIISGAENNMATYYAKREHFHNVFTGIKNKNSVVEQLINSYQLKPEEIAFFFDDIIDLPVASQAGLRFFISRNGGHLLNSYVINHELADYIPASTSYPLRECCELFLGALGIFNEVVEARIHFEGAYNEYWTARNLIETIG
ncbi:MAG: hypothetical protein RQ866_01485 [Bacteroidales bacterium]|nr:hypothetical protein [Bacteroidales bacterium]